jgi:hypothetical protein
MNKKKRITRAGGRGKKEGAGRGAVGRGEKWPKQCIHIRINE